MSDRVRRLRVVIVDEELPYPATSGKRIRILNLARHLSRHHHITFLCHRNGHPHEEAEAEEHLRACGIETLLVDRCGPARFSNAGSTAFPIKVGLNTLSSLPFSVQWNRCPNLQRAVRKYAREHAVDIWQCEWAPYATTFLASEEAPWVMMAHDIQSLIWERHYRAERNWGKRRYIKRQWRRYCRYERRVFSTAACTITVSDQDAERAAADFGAQRTSVVENGVDVAHYQQTDLASRGSPRRLEDILFLGNLEWRPNLDAVRLLLDEVFPRVIAKVPAARLIIVGRRPPRWLVRRCCRARNVELHPDVADVRPLLRQCGMMAVPLRFASGSRLKILEALATGMPVVSTGVGAEGLRLRPGEHFARADTIEEMAEVVVALIRDPGPANAMARAGQQVVEQHYDWRVLARKMEAAWQELVHTGIVEAE